MQRPQTRSMGPPTNITKGAAAGPSKASIVTAPTILAPQKPRDPPPPLTEKSPVGDAAPTPHPNVAHDPDPAPSGASQQEKDRRKAELLSYSQEMYDTYREIGISGEDLWCDFITTFRPHTIQLWPKTALSRWTALLKNGDVYVDMARTKPRQQALIDILYREHHIPEHPKRGGEASQAGRPTVQFADRGPTGVEKDVLGGGEETACSGSKASDEVAGAPDPDPDPSSPSSSDEEQDHGESSARWRMMTGRSNAAGSRGKDDDAYDDYNDRSLGINGLMKAFKGKKPFTGSWEEDLDNCLGVFETLSDMCQITEAQMLRSIPIMLDGDALDYYSRIAASCATYGDAKSALRRWYNSDEKRARILTAWKSLVFSEEMSKRPDDSEVAVFRDFVARLMALQKQLDTSYHADRFLRDRLLTAVDLPALQTTLRDRIPRSSHQAVQRIANQLSDKKGSAGSTVAMIAGSSPIYGSGYENEALYSLGRTYGGDAKRRVKTPWRKRGNYERRGGRDGDRQRRLRSSWMRGVKGYFVCGGDHRANAKHPRAEVTAAVKKLKDKHPTALLSVEDLDAVLEMAGDEEGGDESGSEVGAQWADEFEEEEEECDLAFVADYDLAQLEASLANAALEHGRSIKPTNQHTLVTMNNWLHPERPSTFDGIRLATPETEAFLSAKNGGSNSHFDGLRLDTCANRASVMSRSQYLAYTIKYGLKETIRPATHKGIRGIGGVQKAVWVVRVQIPFDGLRTVIDVDFLIIEDDFPTLLSMKYMVTNGLDISLQRRCMKLGKPTHPLSMENFFLIHRWDEEAVPHVLYTEQDLRRMHRGFGHPTIKSLERLLRSAEGGNMSKQLKSSLRKISEDCKVCKTYAGKPRRFKLTVGTEGLRFNNRVLVDTMFIQSRPVMHMIDEATHFSAACFLRKQSTSEIWATIRRLWILSYMGPPDHLMVDQGTAYTSKEMRENLESFGVALVEAPIENPGSIGIVERYHAPLRAAHKKIRASLDRSTSDAECLQMNTYAMNSIIGPEGLCPMMLVFGALPRPARSKPSPTQLERATAIENAKKEVEKETARRRIVFALRHPSSLKGKELSAPLRELPDGAPVLVYRPGSKTWEGPHKFLFIDDETVVLKAPPGRKIFRSSCVKPYTASVLTQDLTSPDGTKGHPKAVSTAPRQVKILPCSEGDLRIFAVKSVAYDDFKQP